MSQHLRAYWAASPRVNASSPKTSSCQTILGLRIPPPRNVVMSKTSVALLLLPPLQTCTTCVARLSTGAGVADTKSNMVATPPGAWKRGSSAVNRSFLHLSCVSCGFDQCHVQADRHCLLWSPSFDRTRPRAEEASGCQKQPPNSEHLP